MIRPLTEKDEEDVIEIGRQVWGGHDYVPSTFHTWLEDELSHPQAIEIEGTVVCFANLRVIDDGRTAWFEGLRTHPEWRGQGLARRITEHLAVIAEQLEVDRIRYTTASTNEASLKIAHHIGMKERYRMRVTWFHLGKLESHPSSGLKGVGTDKVIQLLSDCPSLIPMNTIVYDWKVLEASPQGVLRAAESNRFWLYEGVKPSLSLGKQRNEDDGVLWCFTIYALQEGDFLQHLNIHIKHAKDKGYAEGMATYQLEFSRVFSELIPDENNDRGRTLVCLDREI